MYGRTRTRIIMTVEKHFQGRFSCNVWAGVVGNQFVGPHFIQEKFTAHVYRNFLVNALPILLENVTLEVRQRIRLMHDDAPAHRAAVVTTYLDEMYHRRWIGYNGGVKSPPGHNGGVKSPPGLPT